MRYKIKLSCLLAVMIFLMLNQGHAQSIKRQTIASFGSSQLSDGVVVQQTVGQPYATSGYYSSDMGYRPGFQQSSDFQSEPSLKPELTLSLNIYPNPAAESVTVESPEVIKQAVIKVTDINGRTTVKEEVGEFRKHVIKCDAWPDGVYFISLYNNQENIFSSKIVKN